MLIIVLATMTLIAGIVAGMTYHAGALHAQLQQQRLDATMRYATESAAAYVRHHREDWMNDPPRDSLKLESDALTRGTNVAEITINCGESAELQTCMANVKLTHHRHSSRKSTQIRLGNTDSND